MRRIHYVNAFSGLAQVVVNIILTVLIVPVFITRLGLKNYGIYALISAVGQVGVFTNFGFNTTIIKYLAEQQDREESNYDIIVTFIVIGGTALSVAALLLVFRDFVLFRILNVSPDIMTSSVYLFYLFSIVANAFVVIGQIPGAVLDSQQRVYITNGIQLGVGVLAKVLILGSLILKPDLAVIGIILASTSAAGFGMLALFARRIWGPLSYDALGSRFLPVARKHFRYGRSVYATSVMGFFYEPVTKILISHYLGLAEVGFFDIAIRVKSIVLSLIERLLYPVLPLLAAKKKIDESRNIHDEVQRKLIILVIPMVIAIVFTSRSLVFLWLGSTLWPVVIGVAAIVSCFVLAQVFVPLYQFMLVKGHPDKTLMMQVSNVAVNMVLFVISVPMIGYYGVVESFSMAILSSISLAAWYQWSILHTTPFPSRDFTVKMVKLAGTLLSLNLLSVIVVRDSLSQLLLLLTVNFTATVALFRSLKVISALDIDQYVGRGNWAGIFLERMLVR